MKNTLYIYREIKVFIMLGKLATKFITGWITGEKSLLATRPVKINLEGIKYRPALEHDTVQFTAKKLAEINTKADELLKDLKRFANIDYIEKIYPDVVENVRLGKINSATAQDYSRYKTLETFRSDYPEAFVLFGKEGALDLPQMLQNYGNIPIQIVKEMPLNQIKQTYAEVDAFAGKLDFEPQLNHYMNALIMKKYNPEAYKYLMSGNDIKISPLFKNWGGDSVNIDNCPTSTMLKNITPEQIHSMVYDRLPGSKYIGAYVENSDSLVRNENNVKRLSEDLLKVRLSTDVKSYRGEKTVGMFDSIEIDKGLEKQIRQLLEKNKNNAKNMQVTSYTGNYNSISFANLYDFLSSKENLTLADAMQMAKYGDENFINEIILRIKNAKLVDTRFKSYSFDEGMAAGWRKIHTEDNTTIIQRATINKGTEGGFHEGNNAQYEIILNNTPKEIVCNNVLYDKETDTFVLDTIVRNI